jgi:hypothetical protein
MDDPPPISQPQLACMVAYVSTASKHMPPYTQATRRTCRVCWPLPSISRMARLSSRSRK